MTVKIQFHLKMWLIDSFMDMPDCELKWKHGTEGGVFHQDGIIHLHCTEWGGLFCPLLVKTQTYMTTVKDSNYRMLECGNEIFYFHCTATQIYNTVVVQLSNSVPFICFTVFRTSFSLIE